MEPDEENALNSESEDDDYVPGAEPNEVVSEEEEDGDPEGKSDESRKRKKKSAGGKQRTKRQRRRKRDDDDETDDDSDDQDFTVNEKDLEENQDEIETEDPETKARRELMEKERTDRLWEDFLTDVETTQAKRRQEKESGFKTPTEKVVTKVYDFAGQRVQVQEKVKIDQRTINGVSTSLNGTTTGNTESNNGSESGNSEEGDTPKRTKKYRISFLSGNPAEIGLGGGKGVSAKEGLSNVLNALQAKKKKIGTLEKSKLDWEAYKQDQNIHEEMSIHNRSKNGFIDKQEFLQRADVRQFEIEKAARSKRRKPL